MIISKKRKDVFEEPLLSNWSLLQKVRSNHSSVDQQVFLFRTI